MDKTRFGKRRSVHLVKQRPDSSRRVRSLNTAGREAQLTPLKRLERFKESQERLASQINKKEPPHFKKGQKALLEKMENEAVIVNGSHEPSVGSEEEEKVLKPRKPVMSNEQEEVVVQNGGSENGINGVENGFEEIVELNKRKKSPSVERKESTPQKQLKTDSPTFKRELRRREVTPKPHENDFEEIVESNKRIKSPSVDRKESTPQKQLITDSPTFKRELRRREVTPKPQKEVKLRGTPQKAHQVGESKTAVDRKKSINGDEHLTLSDETIIIEGSVDESVIFVDENVTEEIVIVEKEPATKGFFSVFDRNSNTSVEVKEACEASSSSSPSVVCLGTPSDDEKFASPSSEIRSRRGINSFSRFPGRNVSITSFDSLKRKADDSIEERQRFVGETESGSEKSPGWFFSRVWSPEPKKPKTNISSSTPFSKRVEQDSMAVNYNEDTKMSLGNTLELQVKDDSSSNTPAKKWCTIM